MDTTTKERPIIFRGDGVLGILEDRKTKTRRVIKPQPPVNCREWAGWVISSTSKSEVGDATWTDVPGVLFNKDFHIKCPYGQPGDRLWVRETFVSDGDYIGYRAERDPANDNAWWTPAIFMPRWASRINLEIVSVRVERIQSISEADAFAEGISGGDWLGDPVGEFKKLWNSINKKRGFGWETNCWVWVLEFRRIDNAKTD